MDFDLLEHVQGSEGCFAVLGLKNERTRQNVFSSREEFNKEVAYLKEREYDVYFGVSKYATVDNRKKSNVLNTKAIWIDLDCGEKKALIAEGKTRPDGYRTQSDAIVALQAFCKKVGLPKPTLVNSGGGIHAYWALDEALPKNEWEPIAKKLKQVCFDEGLFVDGSVFEIARVLRLPGTFNYKNGSARPVEVMCVSTPVPVSRIREILDVNIPLRLQGRDRDSGLSPLQQSLKENRKYSFERILLGCKQMAYQMDNQPAVSEPMWFDAISIASRCVEHESAIHEISSKHPDYSFDNTEAKADNAEFPHTCETFESNNPGGCKGCPHKGKIGSPITLGTMLPRNELLNDEVDPSIFVDDSSSAKEPQIVMPKDYFVTTSNEIAVDRGDGGDSVVYDHRMHIIKRVRDSNPEIGEMIIVRLYLPHDDVREFPVPLSIIGAKDKLHAALAAQGVVATSKQMEQIMGYVIASTKTLQCAIKAENMRSQFGWVDRNSKFIIGSDEVTKNGVAHSPPSNVTLNLSKYMEPKGTLDGWKEVFQLYGAKGLEPNAFAALSAFGSPLLKFTGQNGAIINLIHKSSGTGKSTALYMCSSVYGHPVRLVGTWRDTMAAQIIKMGIMNNLPIATDELTNLQGSDLSTLSYCASQGCGPDRAKSSANELRANNTTWQTIMLTSSNSSFYDKLNVHKRSPDGEMMRLIEYRIAPTTVIDRSVAKIMFDRKLRENYGHAGRVYAQYIVSNLEEVIGLFNKTQSKIDNEANLTNRERFWSATIACNITGGYIAKKLGLIDWDMEAIYKWALGMLEGIREDTIQEEENDLGIIGEYVNNHIDNILVVNDATNARTGMQALPIKEPRGELVIRYEPDTQMLYLANKSFKRYCVERQIAYKDVIRTLEIRGMMKGVSPRRLSKGMSILSAPVSAIVIDCSKDRIIDLNDIKEN